jgi:hypothetical protein
VIYDGVIICARLCPFCLGDETRDACFRWNPMASVTRDNFHAHVAKHIDEGIFSWPMRCPHPRCDADISSPSHFWPHAHSIHGLDPPNISVERPARKYHVPAAKSTAPSSGPAPEPALGVASISKDLKRKRSNPVHRFVPNEPPKTLPLLGTKWINVVREGMPETAFTGTYNPDRQTIKSSPAQFWISPLFSVSGRQDRSDYTSMSLECPKDYCREIFPNHATLSIHLSTHSVGETLDDISPSNWIPEDFPAVAMHSWPDSSPLSYTWISTQCSVISEQGKADSIAMALKCPENGCYKVFEDHRSLTGHLSIHRSFAMHSGKRTILCSCGKTFSSFDPFAKHFLEVHECNGRPVENH